MSRRRRLLSASAEDNDPVAMLTNLFDVAMVFAVALMVAMVVKFNMTEIFSRYKPSENQNATGKKGRKVGVAYELENGEVIYVPE